jgi:sulfite exporter TauE/SafE
MCGPLAAASCRSAEAGKNLSKPGLISYALARAASYGMLGFAAGLIGAIVLKDALSLQARTLSLTFAVLMFLWAMVDLIRGMMALRAGKPMSPLAHMLQSKKPVRGLSGILSLPLPSGVALGIATAVLPCGFLAAAYLQAAILGHPVASAVAMMVFALATTPALLGGAFASLGIQKLLPRYAPIVGSFLLLIVSVLLIFRAFPSSGGGHSHHEHPQPEQHQPQTQPPDHSGHD